MDETRQKIIEIFKKRGGEISTAEILSYVYPELKTIQSKEDKDSKRKLAQIHRKLLYHINEFVNSGILRFSKFGEKGLKFFTLAIAPGEEITEINPRYKKRIVISAPSLPSMPIESYEHQGIIIKYEPSTWIDKLNSVVVMSEKIASLKELENIFDSSISVINDCLCFNNFDFLIDKLTKNEIIDFIQNAEEECKDYGKKTSLILNLSKLKIEKFKDILEKITEAEITNVIFIYNFDSEELQEHFALFKEIISTHIRKKRTIYLKNRRICKAPYFLGTAGPYCMMEKEWLEREAEEYKFVACSQCSLIVDVEKFYSLYGLDTIKFSDLMINVSKSFLSANALKRRKSQDYFKNVINLDKKNEKEFLEFSRNYIRFWNFGLMQPDIDPKLVLNMVSEARKKVNSFSVAEETIYKSCGMPTRFKIAISCAFKESNEKLSPAKYKRLEITNLDDLYRPKIKKEISDRESITSMFDGGNDVTFHRSGSFTPEDISREISVIMNAYNIPMFSFNFGNIKGDMKLSSYL